MGLCPEIIIAALRRATLQLLETYGVLALASVTLSGCRAHRGVAVAAALMEDEVGREAEAPEEVVGVEGGAVDVVEGIAGGEVLALGGGVIPTGVSVDLGADVLVRITYFKALAGRGVVNFRAGGIGVPVRRDEVDAVVVAQT